MKHRSKFTAVSQQKPVFGNTCARFDLRWHAGPLWLGLIFAASLLLQPGCTPPQTADVLPPKHEQTTAAPEIEFSPVLVSFLEKFDALDRQGYVPTLRSGSTGIGYTLETMLEIEENNSPAGDFYGMELKAFRDEAISMTREKMNLFLKEPKWCDERSSKDRVRDYGYVDDNGRTALYSTVTINENAHGLGFELEPDNSKLWICFRGTRVGSWTREVLEKRLLEKHSETVFVSAHATGKGKQEQFHYYGVLWCQRPSVDRFMQLLKEGDVMLEMRMHLKESGSVRNHGSAFRIKQNRITDLFDVALQVRPTDASESEFSPEGGDSM